MANNANTTTAKTEETKAQKFKRLGTVRMNAALVAFDKMESLATSSAYEYTPEQAAKMVEVLRTRVDNLEKLFKGEGDVGGGFSF